jgi:hypothetical protein
MAWRHVPRIDDDMSGVSTYALDDGRHVRISNHMVREYGAAGCLYRMGLIGNPEKLPRKPLYWDGRKIGTVPAFFDPRTIRSKSWLYDPRPGDFVEEGGGWRASGMLGPGDIEAIEGFIPDPPSP